MTRKRRSGEANKFEERYAELERKIPKPKLQPPHRSSNDRVYRKMRSGRFVAESERKCKTRDESEASRHERWIAMIPSTESEQAEGLVVEAAAAAAVHHSIGNAFAESTEFEHADGRTVVGAAAALDLDDDASTTTAATCALSEETNTAATKVKNKRRDYVEVARKQK